MDWNIYIYMCVCVWERERERERERDVCSINNCYLSGGRKKKKIAWITIRLSLHI